MKSVLFFDTLCDMQNYAAEFADFLDNDVELLADSDRLKTMLSTKQYKQVRKED